MAVTVKGFQGTVSDADMATQIPQVPGVVVAAGDLAPTAVAGARTVSIAAGTAVQHFVKYTSDAAQTLPLTPPGSGGKWYLVALNRQWSPTNTCVLEAVDTGATNDGTIPTVIPAAVLSAAQSVTRSNPGTAGSTVAYGTHQTLALAHVRAADTTVTVFDLRAIRTGTGGIAVPNLHALAHSASYTLDGAIASVLPISLDGTVRLLQSTWQRVLGVWRPLAGSGLHVDSGTSIAAYLSGLTALFANFQQPYQAVMGWPQGQRARDNAGFDYGWGRAGASWTLEPGPNTRLVMRCNGNPGAWPDNTNQAPAWDTIVSDPMGMGQAGGDTRRIKYPVAGRYRHSMAIAPNGGDIANVELSVPVYNAAGDTFDHRGPSAFFTYCKSDKPLRAVQEAQVQAASMTSYFWGYRNDGNASRGVGYGNNETRPEWVVEYLGPLGS